MTGMIAKKFQDRMKTIPTHLQYTKTNRGVKYAELLAAVDLMSKERCLEFTIDEFKSEYGIHGVASFRSFAKKAKLTFLLRVVSDSRTVIIFKNDLPTSKG